MKQMTVAFVCVLVLSLGFTAGAEYFDFGGATIHIMNQGHHPALRFIEGDFPGDPMLYGISYGLHEEAERLFNCKIEFHMYPWMQYKDILLTRLLSGDSAYDLWFMNSALFWAYMSRGVFLPLNEVLPPEYFENLPPIRRGVAASMSFAGNNYAFGYAGEGFNGLSIIIYNKGVFEELALPDLQEVYLAGDWTWDKMIEIARQIAADTTGDGNIDRFGLMGIHRFPMMRPFLYTNNRAAMVRWEENGIRFTGNEENFIEGVNTIASWIAEGIIDRRNLHQNVFSQEVADGRLAMAITDVLALNFIDGGDYSIVPLPRGPQAEEHLHSVAFVGSLTLPYNSRHPEGMIQLAHFLYPREDYLELMEETIRLRARDRVSAQILYDMAENWSGFVGSAMGDNSDPVFPAWQAVNQALAGTRPIAGSMAELASALQAALDDVYKTE